MKNYYQTLGVAEDATEREIKQAHHQLALRLHPDRTPDPVAQAQFLEVQEAYDILGDRHRRLAYDMLRQRARELAAAPRHGPSPYDPPSAPVNRRRAPSQKEIWAAQMRSYVPWSRRINWAIAAFCLTLALDWALPTRELPDEYVIAEAPVSVSASLNNPMIAYLITTSNTQFKISEQVYDEYPLRLGEPLTVWRTPLLGIVRRLQPHHYHELPPYGGDIYGTLAFWPMALLLTATVGLLPRRPDELRVNAAVVAVLLLIITVFVLVKSG